MKLSRWIVTISSGCCCRGPYCSVRQTTPLSLLTLVLRFCQFSIKCGVYCSERTTGYWLLNLWIKDVNWIDNRYNKWINVSIQCDFFTVLWCSFVEIDSHKPVLSCQLRTAWLLSQWRIYEWIKDTIIEFLWRILVLNKKLFMRSPTYYWKFVKKI